MPKIGSQYSVLHGLWYRELNLTGSNYRLSLKLLHKLICDKKSSFLKIWEAHSKQPITCEDGKLYFDNYHTCLTLCGRNSLPSTLYKLKSRSKEKRIEDCIVYSGPLFKTLTEPKLQQAFFLALTGDNWLECYSNQTGELLQQVYLGPTARYKFRHVDWETHGEQVVIQSVQNQSVTPTTQPGIRPRVLEAIAMFSVFPMEFKALVEIDREVFGKDCNHVNISEGLLIIGVGNSATGRVRLYNFVQVVKEGLMFEAKLQQPCEALEKALVGSYPAGIPLNCKLKAPPQLLFEVSCADYTIHVGGHPFHFITTPPRHDGVFQVCSLASSVLVENGYLNFPTNSTEPDSVTFHPDDSGRIVYNSAHNIKIFDLKENGQGITSLNNSFELSMNNGKRRKQGLKLGTARLREAKKTFSSDFVMSCEKSILSDDYENELDIYSLLGFDPEDESCHGKINIHDNETGQLIKSVDLKMKMDELADHTLTMDLETFVIITRNECRRFSCYVYRLFRPNVMKDPLLGSRSKKAKTKKKRIKDSSNTVASFINFV
ncbi:DDB1- and CUL4-associated factor 17-like isoform X2 [Limulus polyphemus]|nr:DDB1- and CUL4-associated factor 17-like isoform X2 [Limulus polyphemus]XP_022237927.1 DDB1- and CUL4-associated factor 17-like isoform X2 [Limulus polyphemus]XP_022237928.1 DDB1- and CUL4-associated factor 17-like isoform X2 [Limulus polyphemus]